MARSEKNTGIEGTESGGNSTGGSSSGGSSAAGNTLTSLIGGHTAGGLVGGLFGDPLLGSAIGGVWGSGGLDERAGANNDVWDYIDPFGWRKEYIGNDTEAKYGPKPTAREYPKYGQYGGGAGGGYPGAPGGGGLYPGQDESYYSGLRGEYANMIGGLDRNVDANDPAMLAAMQNAREASARQAKLRGLSGPSSIGMSERDSYMAGLDYQQRENARRQALRAQLMGQYGNMLGGRGQLGLGYGNLGLGYAQLGEQGRQFDVGLMRDIDRQEADAYNQRVAAHNTPLGYIPFVGQGLQAGANAKNRA